MVVSFEGKEFLELQVNRIKKNLENVSDDKEALIFRVLEEVYAEGRALLKGCVFMGDAFEGWRMIIERSHGIDDLWVEPTKDWEKVLNDARNEFDRKYLIGSLQYAHPTGIRICALYTDRVPDPICWWGRKEEVGQ